MSFWSTLGSTVTSTTQQQWKSMLSTSTESTTQQPVVLCVYVHGFMGSDNSFHSFPNDLLTAVSHQSANAQPLPYTFKYKHFVYDTHGDNAAVVGKLVKFLIAEAPSNSSQEIQVVLLAHSMGGPLSLDATREIHRMAGGNPAQHPVRIRGIISFDSPFFGLHSNTITSAGSGRMQDVISNTTDMLGIFNRVTNGNSAANATTSTTVSKGATKTASNVPAAASSGSYWGAALGAAVAAGTAYSIYSSNSLVKETVNRTVSDQYAKTNGYMQFLGPLWKVEDQQQRFEDLKSFKWLYFHGIFLSLKSKQMQQEQTFTQVTQSTDLVPLFSKHSMCASSDVIDAHMNMFSESHDRVAYLALLQRASECVCLCMNRLSN
ncbi:hypothetical protein MT418_000819 [Batrachochytrium dendrobatidis]